MEKRKKEVADIALAGRVSGITIAANLFLSCIKLIAGVFAHSQAMVSDAIHSASDVLSTVVVIIGMRLSARESDREHPYGHERLECEAAILLAMVLFITGLAIGAKAWTTILDGVTGRGGGAADIPGRMALYAAILSILVKEGMYRYTWYYAKKLDSSAMKADAWHHRSDALSSIGALIGIAGARMGHPMLDPAASLVIFLFISKAAYDIFHDAMDKMVDRSCSEEMEEELNECVRNHSEVLAVDLLQTRMFGNKAYVDMEIEVAADASLVAAHQVAEEIHAEIEEKFPKVKHVMVHVNPGDPDRDEDPVKQTGIIVAETENTIAETENKTAKAEMGKAAEKRISGSDPE